MSNCIQAKGNYQSENYYHEKGQLYLFCLNQRHNTSYDHSRKDYLRESEPVFGFFLAAGFVPLASFTDWSH